VKVSTALLINRALIFKTVNVTLLLLTCRPFGLSLYFLLPYGIHVRGKGCAHFSLKNTKNQKRLTAYDRYHKAVGFACYADSG